LYNPFEWGCGAIFQRILPKYKNSWKPKTKYQRIYVVEYGFHYISATL